MTRNIQEFLVPSDVPNTIENKNTTYGLGIIIILTTSYVFTKYAGVGN